MCLALHVTGHGLLGRFRWVVPTSELVLLDGEDTPDMVSVPSRRSHDILSAYITVVDQDQGIVGMGVREEGDAHVSRVL